MTKTADIRDKLSEFIIAELLSGDGSGLDPSTDLLKTGLLDSMSIVMLTEFIGRELGVDVPPDDLTPNNLRTISSITELVMRRADAVAV